MSIALLTVFGVMVIVAAWLAVSWALRYRAVDRIRVAEAAAVEGIGAESSDPTGPLARWLFLANYRRASVSGGSRRSWPVAPELRRCWPRGSSIFPAGWAMPWRASPMLRPGFSSRSSHRCRC